MLSEATLMPTRFGPFTSSSLASGTFGGPNTDLSYAGIVTPRCFVQEPSPAEPTIIPSIASAAGIGRFVYLIGHSQQRYVFSAISTRQISLYHDAVFAVVEGEDTENLWVGDYVRMVNFLNDVSCRATVRIYVHLLAEDAVAKDRLIEDFCLQH